jgi:chromate transporter
VLEALVKVSKRAVKGWPMAAIAAAAFIAIAFLNVPFPLIVIGAALVGALLHLGGGDGRAASGTGEVHADIAMPEWTKPNARRFWTTTAVWLAIWFLPLVALRIAFGAEHVFAAEALFFSKMAAVTFGGAYAVLSYVAQQAVEVYHWLQPDEMLTGLGLAETTPGPLILVLVFVGFLGGARQSGLAPLAGGLSGAVITLWFTFVPCFLWIFAGAPYVETVRSVLWFGLHVLFGEVGSLTAGPLALPVPELATFDWKAAVIALAAGIALLGYKVNLLVVLAAAMVAGVVLSLV